MAKNLKNDEEREQRVLLVGSLFNETGMSTRQLAIYITDNYFPISNCTVSNYLKRYCKLKPEELETIQAKIVGNTPDSLDKQEVRDRVETNVKLFEQGYTIEEIAKATDKNYWSVYLDITRRAKTLNPERYENIIKPQLKANSNNNLQKK